MSDTQVNVGCSAPVLMHWSRPDFNIKSVTYSLCSEAISQLSAFLLGFLFFFNHPHLNSSSLSSNFVFVHVHSGCCVQKLRQAGFPHGRNANLCSSDWEKLFRRATGWGGHWQQELLQLNQAGKWDITASYYLLPSFHIKPTGSC